MKTIITGTRNLKDAKKYVYLAVVNSRFQITDVLSGNSGNVDLAGEEWCRSELKKEPILFPPNWNEYGRAAGPIRNQTMVNFAEALILVWNGKSAGSYDVLSRARKRGIQVFTMIVTTDGKYQGTKNYES